MKKTELGSTYRDVITNITGVATAVVEHITGCRRVMLEWADAGKMYSEWIDEQRLKDVTVTQKTLPEFSAPAGSRPAPSRNDPR